MDFCGVSNLPVGILWTGDLAAFFVVQNLDCRQTSVVLSKGKISYVKCIRALRILCERKQDDRNSVRLDLSFLFILNFFPNILCPLI